MPGKSRTQPWTLPWRRIETSSHTREVEKPEEHANANGPPLGDIVHVITVAELVPKGKLYARSAVISDVDFIASYNWVENKSHEYSIVIPGKPPRWMPPEGETRLTEDAGYYPRDKNAFRYLQHPFEPAVIAMLAMSPEKLDKLNIVACSATMGRLMQFIQFDDVVFRMHVEVIDGVAFFVRQESSPTVTIHAKEKPGKAGYGHTFPESYTVWDEDVPHSSSHQRVIRYTFGILNIAIRFEGDGFLPEHDRSQDDTAVVFMDDLQKYLANHNTAISPGSTKLGVKVAGQNVSQGSVFELRTRALVKKTYEDTFAGVADRLWLTQVNRFVLAYHEFGTFNPENIEVQNVKEKVKQWEVDHNRSLSMLAALLRLIIAETKAQPNQKLEICCVVPGRLEMRKQATESDTLSPAVKTLWCHRSLA